MVLFFSGEIVSVKFFTKLAGPPVYLPDRLSPVTPLNWNGWPDNTFNVVEFVSPPDAHWVPIQLTVCACSLFIFTYLTYRNKTAIESHSCSSSLDRCQVGSFSSHKWYRGVDYCYPTKNLTKNATMSIKICSTLIFICSTRHFSF
jgi:hypothetical protein